MPNDAPGYVEVSAETKDDKLEARSFKSSTQLTVEAHALDAVSASSGLYPLNR